MSHSPASPPSDSGSNTRPDALATHGQPMAQAINHAHAESNLPLYMQAVEALLAWQLAPSPEALRPYNDAMLLQELQQFPQGYLTQHRGAVIDDAMRKTLDGAFGKIVLDNLAWPGVAVHRDFSPRNLVVPAPIDGAYTPKLLVLEFGHALHGPITYDIASLMRDAFRDWDENFVLDVTIRYWDRARAAGLPVGQDFGAFYRAVEWMGLQRHLWQAGQSQYLQQAPRLLQYIRATASRYIELKPLLRLIDKVEGTQDNVGYVFGRS